MATQNAQRKAWNDAMRSAAGVSSLPLPLQRNPTKRRSDRRKKQDRRDKARKVVDSLSSDDAEYRSALWMDALEGVDPSIAAAAEDEEEYDVLDEFDDEKTTGSSKGKRKRGRGGGKGGGGSSTSSNRAGVISKRLKPRSLATILMEDINKEPENVVKEYLGAEARLLNPKQQLPVRKFCPVTGLYGIYTEPKSNISYANLKALEQIRERAPPWMTLSGTPAYWETVKSIRDEE